MKYLFAFTFLFIISSCREKSPGTTATKTDSTSIAGENPVEITQENSSNISLIGPWTSGLSDNALFDVRKDSIFYVEDLESYKYILVGDSIKIYYPGYTFSGKVNLQQDTLTITSEGEESRYWRFRDSSQSF